MAHVLTNSPSSGSLRAMIAGFFSAMANRMAAESRGSTLLHQVDALLELSDAELADRGLKRSDVARHVFIDNYWT